MLFHGVKPYEDGAPADGAIVWFTYLDPDGGQPA